MSTKKYISLDRMQEYDTLIKQKIVSGDDTVLASAKSYADSGDTATLDSSKSYTDGLISGVNEVISNISTGATVVKEAEHATNADAATNAENATHAENADEATHATSADSATSATKATQDANGNVIVDTYETKTDAQAKLTEAKEYTDGLIESHIHSWNDLTDKPFGEEVEVVYPETTINGVFNKVYGASENVDIADGDEVVVVWDGVEYPVTATVPNDAETYLGNLSFYSEYWEDSGEPFAISMSSDSSGEQLFEIKANDTGVDHVAYILKTTITPIDYKYMPDGYPRSEIELQTLVEETTVTIESDENPVENPFVIDLVDGRTYIVTFDNVAFECIAHYEGVPYVGAMTYIGNPSVGGLGDIIDSKSNEPFFYTIFNGSGLFFANSIGNHTIIIDGIIETITTIDEKYIPNSIVNSAGLKFEYSSVMTCDGETVVAAKGAEIFNNYEERTYFGTAPNLDIVSGNIATGEYSHAEGDLTTATGYASHAEGGLAIASGNYSHAEGRNTTASGNHSHAEGWSTTASGKNSHAEGYDTTATGYASHAEGDLTNAIGASSHAEGNLTNAIGASSHAEGNLTNAIGASSHAEGSGKCHLPSTITANTDNDTILSEYSNGMFSLAKGEASHVEGMNTLALGAYSHAEGCEAKAIGQYSHAEGYNVEAIGYASHVEGDGTVASGAYSHVQGKYNVDDVDANGNALGTYLHIVGNGKKDSNRSNAHTLAWDGTAWFQGDVYIGSTSGTNRDEGSKKLATTEDVDAAIAAIPSELPAVTSSNAGQVLTVNSEGAWEAAEAASGLPTFTSEDAGKFLRVGSDGTIVLELLTDVSKVGA